MSLTLNGAVVLVTGANGGLGEEFVKQSLDQGAAKVYATARTPREWNDPRVVPLHLDVLDARSIADAAASATDTTVVVNNAGITRRGSLATQDVSDIRLVFDANFFGALEVARAFAPVLGANGGGVLLNVHSVLSWLGRGGAYSAAKAALWSATNSLRLELAPQGTLVSGLHLGYTATPMTAGIAGPKNDPADIVRIALAGIVAGDYEILADQVSVDTKAMLAGTIEEMYPELVRG